MDIRSLKRQALDQKHFLEHLLVIYDAFQSYVESLKPLVTREQPAEGSLEARERFRLKLLEYETLFLEWHEGEQLLNEGIAVLLYSPEEFRGNEEYFRLIVTVATAKFQDILGKAGRSLREMHEKIALEEGQSKAEEITRVPASALTKLKDADAVAEIATKWLGRAVKFAPWVYEMLKGLHS